MTSFKVKPAKMEVTENSTNSKKSKKYGMIASRDQRKPPPPKRKENMDTEEAEKEQTLLQQTRNVKLLKKRLDEKQQEIKRLHTQLSSWREKCLKLENELKYNHNRKRQLSIPVASSEIDPKLPN